MSIKLGTLQNRQGFYEGVGQIIIIGNGFDKACGLKSGFADFFEQRYSQTNIGCSTPFPFSNNPVDKVDCDKVSLWDYCFYNSQHPTTDIKLWCNVENTIKTELVNIADGFLNFNHIIFHCCGKDIYSGGQSQYESKPNFYEGLFYYLNSEEKLDYKYGNVDQRAVYEILFRELRKYELFFADYLVRRLEEHTDYTAISELLLGELINKDVDFDIKTNIVSESIKMDIKNDFTSVVSFNYTDVKVKQDVTKYAGQIAKKNVHGTLEQKNIIFGIDLMRVIDVKYQKSHDKQKIIKLLTPFTKTNRIMFLGNRETTEDVHLGNRRVAAIKFYGHSLSEADYSYFQAIFDKVNLYSSDTILIFYYNPEIPDLRDQQIVNANRLITTYGMTLDNKDHGNNLLHKLMLEDRLFVKPIILNGKDESIK